VEAPNEAVVRRQEVTQEYAELIAAIRRTADGLVDAGSTHDIHLYQAYATTTDISQRRANETPKLDLVLHTTYAAQASIVQAHLQAEELKRTLRRTYPTLEAITVHTEPVGEYTP